METKHFSNGTINHNNDNNEKIYNNRAMAWSYRIAKPSGQIFTPSTLDKRCDRKCLRFTSQHVNISFHTKSLVSISFFLMCLLVGRSVGRSAVNSRALHAPRCCAIFGSVKPPITYILRVHMISSHDWHWYKQAHAFTHIIQYKLSQIDEFRETYDSCTPCFSSLSSQQRRIPCIAVGTAHVDRISFHRWWEWNVGWSSAKL